MTIHLIHAQSRDILEAFDEVETITGKDAFILAVFHPKRLNDPVDPGAIVITFHHNQQKVAVHPNFIFALFADLADSPALCKTGNIVRFPAKSRENP